MRALVKTAPGPGNLELLDVPVPAIGATDAPAARQLSLLPVPGTQDRRARTRKPDASEASSGCPQGPAGWL